MECFLTDEISPQNTFSTHLHCVRDTKFELTDRIVQRVVSNNLKRNCAPQILHRVQVRWPGWPHRQANVDVVQKLRSNDGTVGMQHDRAEIWPYSCDIAEFRRKSSVWIQEFSASTSSYPQKQIIRAFHGYDYTFLNINHPPPFCFLGNIPRFLHESDQWLSNPLEVSTMRIFALLCRTWRDFSVSTSPSPCGSEMHASVPYPTSSSPNGHHLWASTKPYER